MSQDFASDFIYKRRIIEHLMDFTGTMLCRNCGVSMVDDFLQLRSASDIITESIGSDTMDSSATRSDPIPASFGSDPLPTPVISDPMQPPIGSVPLTTSVKSDPIPTALLRSVNVEESMDSKDFIVPSEFQQSSLADHNYTNHNVTELSRTGSANLSEAISNQQVPDSKGSVKLMCMSGEVGKSSFVWNVTDNLGTSINSMSGTVESQEVTDSKHSPQLISAINEIKQSSLDSNFTKDLGTSHQRSIPSDFLDIPVIQGTNRPITKHASSGVLKTNQDVKKAAPRSIVKTNMVSLIKQKEMGSRKVQLLTGALNDKIMVVEKPVIITPSESAKEIENEVPSKPTKWDSNSKIKEQIFEEYMFEKDGVKYRRKVVDEVAYYCCVACPSKYEHWDQLRLHSRMLCDSAKKKEPVCVKPKPKQPFRKQPQIYKVALPTSNYLKQTQHEISDPNKIHEKVGIRYRRVMENNFLFYCCTQCQFRCNGWESFKQHKQAEYEAEDPEKIHEQEGFSYKRKMCTNYAYYYCTQCEFRCHSWDFFKEHKQDEVEASDPDKIHERDGLSYKRIMSNNFAQYQCLQCKYKCQPWNSYKIHCVNKHSAQNVDLRECARYQCSACGKLFGDKFQLEIHTNAVHTKEKSYICEICGYFTYNYSKFKDHIRHKHTENEKYRCTFPGCLKQFTSKGALSDHLDRHSGVRKYKCIKCAKCYKTDKDLRQHMITHNAVGKYRCEKCLHTFHFGCNYRTHVKKCAGLFGT